MRGWWSRFTHGNIRTNLGPLRYVFLTPQAHRVHHRRAAAWHDCNYGAVLSVWDRLFRTQSPHQDVYPETGIDEPFPIETSWRFPIPLFMPMIQMLACLGPASGRQPLPEPSTRGRSPPGARPPVLKPTSPVLGTGGVVPPAVVP